MKTIFGYAVKWNSWSPAWNGWNERFAPHSLIFDTTTDVISTFDHHHDEPLARLSTGTLTLRSDDVGLHYEFPVIPELAASMDLASRIQNKIVYQSSFTFKILDEADDQWEFLPDGRAERTIKRASLVEVAAVVFPWYPDSESHVRGADGVLARGSARIQQPSNVQANLEAYARRAAEVQEQTKRYQVEAELKHLRANIDRYIAAGVDVEIPDYYWQSDEQRRRYYEQKHELALYR